MLDTGNEDVKIAKKAEEDRSRQSLQMRLESYRIQDMAELKYHQKKAAIQEEEKFATLQDRDAIVQAKKEIDEIALRKELAKTFVL